MISAINNNDISEIPKAFHKYCSLSIEQNISKEKFDDYVNGISQDFGGEFQISYISTHTQSDDERIYKLLNHKIIKSYPF